MSKTTIRREIDVINRVLGIGKVGFGLVDSDGLIIVSQKYPVRKLTREQFEAEKKAEGCTEICYIVESWRMNYGN